jgi:hypothetical protein
MNFAYIGLLRIVCYVPGKPTTLKVSVSLRKLPLSLKVTGRSICSSGYDSVKQGRRRMELRSLDPHAVKAGHANNVEATTPVHEHLVHSLGAEERCHHDGVSPRLWNVVGLILSIIRDGRLGPPEV